MIRKATRWIAVGLLAVLIAVPSQGCKKKAPVQDGVVVHTAKNTHKQIQNLRLEITEALNKKELQYIHDNMYYFEGLLESLASQLDGDEKQQLQDLLKDLKVLAVAIDNSAGRGNVAATEANVQKMIERLQELENHFKDK